MRAALRIWGPVLGLILMLGATAPMSWSSPRKVHVVGLGATRKVPYSRSGDPAGASDGENTLRIRALMMDGLLKEWTTGDAHDVTDRSFVVRRAIRLNDALPGEKQDSSDKHWVWQRGPWLLVDRVSGHLIALKLPDYDPGVSRVIWFRDYGAYCGVTSSGKSLYGVVAQVAARKPVIAKKLAPLADEHPSQTVCGPPEWQREPLRITFHPTGQAATDFDLAPGSAVLVEDAGDDADSSTEVKAK
jgi:hypothetical protein